jgi:EAL and modified HD-GYP domain-containing signal transduction protein
MNARDDRTMLTHPVLGQIALGYCPMIDRKREVVATRLVVFPERPDAAPDAAALLAALDEVWPGEACDAKLELTLRPLDPAAVGQRASCARPPVALNVAGEAALAAVMAARPGPQLMLEIPAFMAAEPLHAETVRALHAAGSVLLMKGRPLKPLAPDVLACFSHSIVELADERRGSEPVAPGVRSVTSVQAGVRSTAELEAAFARGAVAVLGWTFDDEAPRPTGRTVVAPDVKVVLDLIDGVERELPASRLESILSRDPRLAYRLMRYLNSPAFGLRVEITSFGHALMLLGYQRLKRWLALLLASASKDPNARPTMYAAVRRGLLMEELARTQSDAEMRSEMFICGVFSLLDRLLLQPFAELLAAVPVPERVRLTLEGHAGAYQPYLDLVCAIENQSVFDIRECSERLLLGPAEVNRALLASLRSARLLD